MCKSDEEIKFRVPEDLKVELMRLADRQDRSLSDYLRHILALHVYGHSRVGGEAVKGPHGE